MMQISVINRSSSVSDEQLQTAIRAINRQIHEDFAPHWFCDGNLRLEGAIGKKEDTNTLPDLRGDAAVYIVDNSDDAENSGIHELNVRGVPYSIINLDLCKNLKEHWSITLSHEVLELLVDPYTNLLAQGPHPKDPKRELFFWVEVCDAVQSQTYFIDQVEVSNFVLPAYFTADDEEGRRNDFLGRRNKDGSLLTSFGINDGGYIGFYDPKTGEHDTWMPGDDELSKMRKAVKGKLGRASKRHAKATTQKTATAPRPLDDRQRSFIALTNPDELVASHTEPEIPPELAGGQE